MMLIHPQDSLEKVFDQIRHELHRGALDHKHPFRFVTLASGGPGMIDARYVVLRKVDTDLNFYFFTDTRTDKVAQINVNPKVALLFYHPGRRLQIRVKGIAFLHRGNARAKDFWKQVQGDAQKAYQPDQAPGTVIAKPEDAYKWPDKMDDRFFTVVQVKPDSMDVLQLNGLTHIRAVFEKTGKEWKKTWIAP